MGKPKIKQPEKAILKLPLLSSFFTLLSCGFWFFFFDKKINSEFLLFKMGNEAGNEIIIVIMINYNDYLLIQHI